MLKGERVLLRPMQQEDIARQHAFNQDVQLAGLECRTARPVPLEKAQAFYEMRVKPADHLAPFAIEAEGQYIGHCELWNVGDRYGNLALTISIGARACWGKGYGREVVRLLLGYGFHYLGARRIHLEVQAKNERALRCFRACGFVEEGRLRKEVWVEGEYTDLVRMSLLREEWAASEKEAAYVAR